MFQSNPYKYRQLFIDNSTIDEMVGVTKILHQPVNYAGNPILRPSMRWEDGAGFVGTVIYDEQEGIFKAWYQGWFDSRYPACYATSEDGIFWHKPELGLINDNSGVPNNRVLDEACVPNVIKDINDPDPDRRYKMLFWDYSLPRPNREASASIAFSPDGIHWDPFDNNPVLTGTGDTHSLLGWDENYQKYVAFIRPGRQHVKGPYRRFIGRSISDDFVTWTDPAVVLVPEEDEPNLEFYNMPVFKYEGIYLGLPWAYKTFPEEPYPRMNGTMDVQLAVSHDGIEWDRAMDRETFISIGDPGNFHSGMVACAKEPLKVGDELWFYCSGSDGDHGTRHRSAKGFLSKLRLDGFVSITAGKDDFGSITTNSFICDGGRLQINTNAKDGLIAVAVLNEDGTLVDGMSHIDTAVVDNDSIKHVVTWEDHTTFDHLSGQNIRLKFYLKSASLYSFCFTKA